MAAVSRRSSGSVRFDPYVKLQWWDERSLAWRDVQRSWLYPAEQELAEEAAEALVPEGARWRLMLVTEEGRRPL